MSRYQVIVGNIGTVYDGDSIRLAKLDFAAYVRLSKKSLGRASGEDVTLMDDCEPEMEYTGWLSMQQEEEDDNFPPLRELHS